jgi:hypothetical protein
MNKYSKMGYLRHIAIPPGDSEARGTKMIGYLYIVILSWLMVPIPDAMETAINKGGQPPGTTNVAKF